MKKTIISIVMLAISAGTLNAQVADKETYVVPPVKSLKTGKAVAALTRQL